MIGSLSPGAGGQAWSGAVAYLAALSVILLVAGLWAARSALAARRRTEALSNELEAARDALWEAEERAERIRAEGERALWEAEARAEAGARAKSRFLATVTHEMRTPLSGVVGAAGLLLDARLAPDQRTYARAILSSAEAMLGLVDEILDLSRAEAEKPPAEEPYSPAAIVEDVAELLAPRARDKGLDFAMRVGAGVPAEAVGDAARIRQVLLNLAGNAVKFTEAGGVGLKVEADAAGLRFTVEDTGPGFDPAETERLFEEFERGEDAAGAPGAGLGLAISRRFASAMGGALSGFAVPGQGATFTLALPARAAAPAAHEPELAGRAVAIVSASPFTAPWLADSLADMGATPVPVAPVDLMVTGRVRLDGVAAALVDRDAGFSPADLAAAARSAGAARALLLLSPADRGDLDRLTEQGFDGYLVKPVRAASLANRILDPLGQEERREQTDAGTQAERPDEPPVADHGATIAPFPSGSGLKLLVAEDDPVSALIALAHLARLGHSSVHVADGEAACEAFEREVFDACLIDMRMPRLDGCAAARRMRAFELETGRAPALLLSLTANVGDDAAARAAGMDGLMTKPLDRRALEAALGRLSAPRSVAVA